MAEDALLPGHVAALLETCPLFRRLSTAELDVIATLAEPAPVSQGSTLFRRGDRAGRLYVVVSGLFRIDWNYDQQTAFALSSASTGDILGWASLVDPFIYVATAIAETESQVVCIGASEMLEFMRARPQAGYDIMTGIAAHARNRIEAVMAAAAGRPFPIVPPIT